MTGQGDSSRVERDDTRTGCTSPRVSGLSLKQTEEDSALFAECESVESGQPSTWSHSLQCFHSSSTSAPQAGQSPGMKTLAPILQALSAGIFVGVEGSLITQDSSGSAYEPTTVMSAEPMTAERKTLRFAKPQSLVGEMMYPTPVATSAVSAP